MVVKITLVALVLVLVVVEVVVEVVVVVVVVIVVVVVVVIVVVSGARCRVVLSLLESPLSSSIGVTLVTTVIGNVPSACILERNLATHSAV